MANTHEGAAMLFDDALTYVGCSDGIALPASSELIFSGYAPSTKFLLDHFASFGIDSTGFDYNALLPNESFILCGSDHANHYLTLASVHRLGFFAKKKLLLPISEDTKVCQLVESDICKNGAVVPSRPVNFYYNAQANCWMPINDTYMERVGQKHVSGFSSRGEEWSVLEQFGSKLPAIPELAASNEWGRRCCWRIRFRIGSSTPWLAIFTDVIGVKELLKMRDVPEGRTRREALKHWVKEHWRVNRTDEETEHRVREHIRGSDTCDWFGLMCKIVPSALDEGKQKVAAAKGREWRSRKKKSTC